MISTNLTWLTYTYSAINANGLANLLVSLATDKAKIKNLFL